MEENDGTEPVQDKTVAESEPGVPGEVAPQTQASNPWRTIGIILVALVIVAVIGLMFFGLMTHPVFTTRLRDIAIIVLALVTMITSIFLAILLFQLQSLIVLLRDEVQPILQSINETTGTVRGTTTFVSDVVVSPMIEIAGYVAGVSTTIKTLFGGPTRTRTSPEVSRQPDQPTQDSGTPGQP
jgi:hypothetical protein